VTVKRVARTLAAVYALAIILAGLAPHCDWLVPGAQAAPAPIAASGHDHHGTNDAGKKTGGECPPMKLAKTVAPPLSDFVLAAPQLATLPLGLSLAALVPQGTASHRAAPRGPPVRTRGGFAAVYAGNHRLLI